jgi:hypothetical protein
VGVVGESALTIAAAMACGSCGSKHAAGSSSTSGSDDKFDAIAGTPHAAASSTGSPKPSSSEGITASDAPCRTATSSSSSSPPVNTTRSRMPASVAHCVQRCNTGGVCAAAMTRWWESPSARSTCVQARRSPSVFLRSSPPATATTYSRNGGGQYSPSSADAGVAELAGVNFDVDAGADRRDPLDRGYRNARPRPSSAAKSEIARSASTVRASGARRLGLAPGARIGRGTRSGYRIRDDVVHHRRHRQACVGDATRDRIERDRVQHQLRRQKPRAVGPRARERPAGSIAGCARPGTVSVSTSASASVPYRAIDRRADVAQSRSRRPVTYRPMPRCRAVG